jgi:subtilisin family serine protease
LKLENFVLGFIFQFLKPHQMKKSIFLIFVTIFQIGLKGLPSNNFYDKNENPSRVLRKDLILVKFIDTVKISRRLTLFEDLKISGNLSTGNLSNNLPVLYKISDTLKLNESLFSLLNAKEIEYASQVYQFKDGVIMAPTNQVLIKLFNSEDVNQLNLSLDQNLILKKEKAIFADNLYILTLKVSFDNSPISIANNLHRSGLFKYVEPNYIRFLKPHTNDQYYSYEWGLNNTGQYNGTNDADIDAPEAWLYTMGSSYIKIAVIDEGVDLTHPDLYDNLLTGYDETGNNSGGAPQGNDAHGTNVAGIIGAINNNSIGITGVAPNCSIVPIRIAYEVWDYFNQEWFWETSNTWIANGIYDAYHTAEADVINCSWGGGEASDVITNTINDALDQGRNGLGCVVVFSAGNYNDSISYPGNLPQVLTVGATSMCDERKRSINDQEGVSCDDEENWGSNFGTQIDIVAPGVRIYSTDLQGSAGYNESQGTSGNYFADFNGTSAACPHVSALAALILSMFPALTNDEVEDIIESTTDKIGSYEFSNHVGRPNGSWNIEVGYGRINAASALSQTDYLTSISGPSLICPSGATFSVPEFEGVTYTWTTSSNIQISGSTTNRTVNVLPANYEGGLAWVSVSMYIQDYQITKVRTKSVSSLISGVITGDEIAVLDFEGQWTVSENQNCFSNLSYEWYVEPNQYPIATGSTFENIFDDEYFSPGYIELYCKVSSGQYYTYIPNFSVQLVAHEPLSVEEIYGDQFVCLDGWGFWGTQVWGGVGVYVYEWSINNEVISNGYDLGNWFYYPEWAASYGNSLNFRVYDDETYADANTFYFDLDWCLQMRDSIVLYPNPATDFINVTLIQSPASTNAALQTKDIFNIEISSLINNKFFTYILIDNRGKPVYQKKTKESTIQIPISSLISGIYYLNVITGNGIINRQVIISH